MPSESRHWDVVSETAGQGFTEARPTGLGLGPYARFGQVVELIRQPEFSPANTLVSMWFS